jgi:hypothetical protein
VDFSTFDSGPGRFFFAHRGIASQSGDLPIAHQRLSEACRRDESLAVRVCEHAAQLGLDRQEMNDASDFQVVKRSYEVKERCDVLVCLNYRADTAALFRCRAFPTVRDWVVQLLEWAKKQGGVRVGIRPHPVTRHSRIKSTDRLEAVVRAVDPDGNFSVWIPPDASVSSYDLIQQAKVVLPFTSTVGIEAVLMDKPIVLGSFCYYDSLGFAHVGATPERYFELVEAGLRGELFPSQEEKKAAALCLYLMMRCRSVHSIFTPQPIDFWKWQAVEPETLWSQEETSDLLESLSMRKPLAWVRHQRAEREWRRVGQCKSSGGSGKGSSFESDGAKPLSE